MSKDTTEYYAALIQESYLKKYDKEANANGYYDHVVEYTTIQRFTSKDEMISWVRLNESCIFDKKEYEIVLCKPVVVTVSLDVKVDINE